MCTPCSLRGLWWRREATGTAQKAGPCTDMPDPRTRIAVMACVTGGSRHESTRPSGRSLQTNLGDGRTRKCVSASTSWTAAYEAHSSKLADPRSVLTHHFYSPQGCKTLTSCQLEWLALLHHSPAGLRFPHTRQGHPVHFSQGHRIN